MKLNIFILAVILFAFSSCTKKECRGEWTCEYKANGRNGKGTYRKCFGDVPIPMYQVHSNILKNNNDTDYYEDGTMNCY